MNDFSVLLQHGASNAWLFVPSAILLGALHGLEPGHSKTMMAAFIVAVRGTLGQAVLLGLSATLSHTAVVWIIALAGMYFGRNWDLEANEGYFQLASAFMIVCIALWMMWRTWRGQRHHAHEHEHGHEHDEVRIVDTGHGKVRLEIFEVGVPPRFRLSSAGTHGHHGHHHDHHHGWAADRIAITLERPDGTSERYTFVEREGFAESQQEIPEPHEFTVRLHLGHGSHSHDYDLEFVEHGHAHGQSEAEALELATGEYQDAHELAHANDIRRRFSNRQVTTAQIVLFGLTGGLVPCPASITVLLLCLQWKQVTLGAALVLCFSIGLAITMVASGALAALSLKHVERRWSGFGDIARKAPYISGALVLVVGCYIGYQGIVAIA